MPLFNARTNSSDNAIVVSIKYRKTLTTLSFALLINHVSCMSLLFETPGGKMRERRGQNVNDMN